MSLSEIVEDSTFGDTSGMNSTASSSALSSAGAGVSGGYEGDSFTLRVLIVFCPALAMYNVLELVILILFTFSRYRGLYFWSLLVSGLGIIPYSLGFLFKFNNITTGSLRWFSVALITIGWYTMVTGQAVVLWSRLHLIVRGAKGDRILRWTKWMIIINFFCLHVPTTVLTFGSNGSINTATFARGYSIMEKIQMSGFFLQEVILSTIYIMSTIRILRTSVREDTRRIMYQLFAINVIIIIMDLALLGLEAASLYLLETIIKGVFYSVKLKLEFAILGRLVQFVGGRGGSIANDERTRQMSVNFPGYRNNSDEKTLRQSTSRNASVSAAGASPTESTNFLELSRWKTNGTNTTADTLPPSHTSHGQLGSVTDSRQRLRASSVSRLRPGMNEDDFDIAFFEHSNDVSLPALDSRALRGDQAQRATHTTTPQKRTPRIGSENV